MNHQKKRLREELMALRKALPLNIVHQYSKAICQQILHFKSYQDARNIAYYHAIHHEVSLMDITVCKKKFYVPKILNHQSMIFCQDQGPFLLNSYGILEPVETQSISIEKLDILFIPMVGFDKHGHRLGMGKGYYDRILATSQSLPLLIGIAYSFQERACIPFEKHDYPMDYIITEKTIFKCNEL